MAPPRYGGPGWRSMSLPADTWEDHAAREVPDPGQPKGVTSTPVSDVLILLVRRSPLRVTAFELPGGEAPDVNVELVESRIGAVMRELDLELHLGLGDRHFTDGAVCTDARTAPCAVGATAGNLAALHGCARFFAKMGFVRHRLVPRMRRLAPRRGRSAWTGTVKLKPDAGGCDARARLPERPREGKLYDTTRVPSREEFG